MSFGNITELLDALNPRVEMEEEAWSDVLARSELLVASPARSGRRGALARALDRTRMAAVPRRRSRRRRALVLVALIVLAFAVVGGTVYALGYHVINFAGAPTAPEPLVREFASLTKGGPPGMNPHAIASEARSLGEIDGSRLWVWPTKAGGFCYEWSPGTAGCRAQGPGPLDVGWSATVVDGDVGIRWVDGVEIRLDDGTTIQPNVVWVSAPINAGFFYYQAPAGRTIAKVLALKGGKVVARA